MSVKKMLNEWRSFINEVEYSGNAYENISKINDENLHDVHVFLNEVGADASGSEFSDLVTLLSKPENMRPLEDLAKLCRESPEDLMDLFKIEPKVLMDLFKIEPKVLMDLFKIKPEVLKLFTAAACSKTLGGSQSPLYGPDPDGADDFI